MRLGSLVVLSLGLLAGSACGTTLEAPLADSGVLGEEELDDASAAPLTGSDAGKPADAEPPSFVEDARRAPRPFDAGRTPTSADAGPGSGLDASAPQTGADAAAPDAGELKMDAGQKDGQVPLTPDASAPRDAGDAGRALDDAGAACEPVTPTLENGQYVIAFDKLRFRVDPRVGARITEFSLAGRNILTGPGVNADNYGSTFWTSPQADWGWPPPAAYDLEPYSAKLDGDRIVLVGNQTVRPFAVRLQKRFWADRRAGALVLEYTVENRGTAPVKVAGWEISRHAALGLTFFPTGERVVAPALPVTEHDAVTWYKNDPAHIRGEFGDKYVADGREGWLAHSDGTLLFVKAFSDVPVAQQPAGEGEIEIYGNKTTSLAKAYVEVEAQGPYTSIAPGGSSTWTVRWYLASVPAGVAVEPGSAALTELARQLVKSGGCSTR